MVAPELKAIVPSVTTNNGISPAQYYTNSFAQQAAMGGDDTFAGLGPMPGNASYLNMGSSVFGDDAMGMGNSFSGYCGYGTQVRDGVMTSKEYLKNELDKRRMQLDAQFDEQVYLKKKTGAVEFAATAADDALTRQIGILQRKIQNNEQDSIIPEYRKLVKLSRDKLIEEGLVSAGQKISEEQLGAYTERLYAEKTGRGLIDDVQANGDSSFVQGMKKGTVIGYAFVDKNNKDTNTAGITHETMDNSSKYWQAVGVVTGGLLTAGLLRQAFRPQVLSAGWKVLKAVV